MSTCQPDANSYQFDRNNKNYVQDRGVGSITFFSPPRTDNSSTYYLLQELEVWQEKAGAMEDERSPRAPSKKPCRCIGHMFYTVVLLLLLLCVNW